MDLIPTRMQVLCHTRPRVGAARHTPRHVALFCIDPQFLPDRDGLAPTPPPGPEAPATAARPPAVAAGQRIRAMAGQDGPPSRLAERPDCGDGVRRGPPPRKAVDAGADAGKRDGGEAAAAPPCNDVLAALTMASTSSVVISALMASIRITVVQARPAASCASCFSRITRPRLTYSKSLILSTREFSYLSSRPSA